MNQNFFDIKMNIIIKFKKNKIKEKKKEKIIKNYFQRKIYSLLQAHLRLRLLFFYRLPPALTLCISYFRL